MAFVVVTGQPGAGKSTIAMPLAARLGLSFLAKDTVKEALAVLSDPAAITVEKSQQLGGASFEVIFALASQSAGAVLEASWNPVLDGSRLANLPGPLIEVHCWCPPEIARQRYIERAAERHWVHLDTTRAHDRDLWTSPGAHGLSEPVVVVDTTGAVDVDVLVREVTNHPRWDRRPPQNA